MAVITRILVISALLLFSVSLQAHEKARTEKPKPVLSPAPVTLGEPAHAENPEEFWSSRVEPLLDKQCLKCHAGVRQRGGLDLRSLDTILRGGDSGPAMVPGKPNESRILQYALPKSDTHMPPLETKKQLSAEEIAVLKTWITLLPTPKSKPAVAASINSGSSTTNALTPNNTLPTTRASSTKSALNANSALSTNNAWVPEYLAEYRRSRQTKKIPPANIFVSAAIDWFLQADWRGNKIESARACDDATFVRRIYLDIAGRIPTPDERKLFLADARANKRTQLIDKLITSDEYPRHLREVFDTVLMGRAGDNTARERAASGWNTYLEESFRANRPWNEMVRDMLVARPTSDATRGAIRFIAERKNSHQAIAEAVAPVVFGVQIKCAQCHNHPLAWEIEQRHYWGLVAVFNRSKNVDTETGQGVAESAIGGFINFANLKKESQPAALVFLNGKNVPERIPAPDEKEVDSPALYVVPPTKDGQKAHAPAVPKFSRREAFAESVTHDNPALAKAFVNRMWANLMGQGIVQTVDQIDSRHRASHPELLEWLSRDFEKSGYDIKRLVRAIVLSRAYQLDSKPSGKTPPRPESFARALEKPLSAEQLLHSLWIATGNQPSAQPAGEVERAFTAAFPDVMPDTYSPSLQQALFLSNSPVLEDLLKPAPLSTTAKLIALPSNEARIREAFLAVLGRAPDAVETKQCLSLLATQSPEKGVKGLLWALLTCAEFQVNH